MAKNRFFEKASKTGRCSCGGAAKRVIRKNFPFGVNSKGVHSHSFSCKECGKSTLIKQSGGKDGKFR